MQSPPVGLIAHCGFARRRLGGAPTAALLAAAVEQPLDAIELDICTTADAALVLRHDRVLPDGRLLADLELSEVRDADPLLLTLDEAVEIVAGRRPLLLDLKSGWSAVRLGRWLRGRGDVGSYGVCTENIGALVHLRSVAPRVSRWPSVPDIGDDRADQVRQVIIDLWRSHAHPRHAPRLVGDVGIALLALRSRRHESVARLGGLPWRRRLPLEVEALCRDIAAAGLCVQHWLVTPTLCEGARRMGLRVNAWTVNDIPSARRLIEAGVESITTDRADLLEAVSAAD